MMTGCLFSAPRQGSISIARSVPRFLRDRIPTYPDLAPPAWMHSRFPDDPAKWNRLYRHVVLEKLDAAKVWTDLHTLAAYPIICCWERLDGSRPDEYCHRTEVAKWFAEQLGVTVEEHVPVKRPPRQLDLFERAGPADYWEGERAA